MARSDLTLVCACTRPGTVVREWPVLASWLAVP